MDKDELYQIAVDEQMPLDVRYAIARLMQSLRTSHAEADEETKRLLLDIALRRLERRRKNAS